MKNSSIFGFLGVFVIGLGLGFLIFGRSSAHEKLQEENQRLRRALLVKERLETSEIPNRPNRFVNRLTAPPVGNRVDVSSLDDTEALADGHEYDLMFSNPEARKLLEQSINKFAEQNRPGIEKTYRPLFESLGISEDESDNLVNHLVSIEKGAREAEQYLLQLHNSRLAYDKNMQQLLGEDDYSKYRDFEEKKPALREYSAFEDFLSRQGMDPLNDSEKDLVVSLMQGAEAYTGETWLDPYGDNPEPRVGDLDVYERTRERMENLGEAANQMLSNAENSEIPEAVIDGLLGYYTENYQQLQRHTDNLGHRLENPELYQRIFSLPRSERQAFIEQLQAEGELPSHLFPANEDR